MSFYPLETQQNTILPRIAAGDETAVQDCITQYGNLIWSLARKFTARQLDAEDAVQEIFFEIWQSAKRFDSTKSKEITFITMIARRRLIDRLRKAYRQPKVESLDNAFFHAPNSLEKEIMNKLQARRIVDGMKSLRPEQRELMFLNIYEGMSHGEIAERKGIPLGTVKTHLRRGFKRVREVVSRNGNRSANMGLA
jgi:RNA polymerase sigma-70 factor (ECF subfamily)